MVRGLLDHSSSYLPSVHALMILYRDLDLGRRSLRPLVAWSPSTDAILTTYGIQLCFRALASNRLLQRVSYRSSPLISHDLLLYMAPFSFCIQLPSIPCYGL
jgi:hypothetical protein